MSESLAQLLQQATFELVPLKNVLDAAADLPEAATVSVTASPAKGLEATIDLAELLAGKGYAVVPHLSARMTRDRAHLAGILGRLDAAGITRAFVVGGDADDPGEFFDALALLRAMADFDHGITEIGVAAYPEGHPDIPDDVLLAAARDKQPYASYMTTQMCFDPAVIVNWVHHMRDEGVTLPVKVGVPGVAQLRKLAQVAAKIGIGHSIRFLTRQHGFLGKLVRPGGYAADELLLGLGPTLDDLAGVHIFTFNQVGSTEHWRQAMLERLPR